MNARTVLGASGLIATLLVVGCTKPEEEVVTAQHKPNWKLAQPQALTSAKDDQSPDINVATHLAAATLLESQGNLGKAITQYRQAITRDPECAEAYHRLGILYGKIGRHRDAEEALQRAVRVRPDSASLRNNLGYEYALQERWADADAELRNAIRLAPTYGRAHVNLGMVLCKLGRFEEGLAEFEETVPPADAYYNLGLMFRSVHRYRDAAQAFRHALKLEPRLVAAQTQLDKIADRLEVATALEPVADATRWQALTGRPASDATEAVAARDAPEAAAPVAGVALAEVDQAPSDSPASPPEPDPCEDSVELVEATVEETVEETASQDRVAEGTESLDEAGQPESDAIAMTTSAEEPCDPVDERDEAPTSPSQEPPGSSTAQTLDASREGQAEGGGSSSLAIGSKIEDDATPPARPFDAGGPPEEVSRSQPTPASIHGGPAFQPLASDVTGQPVGDGPESPSHSGLESPSRSPETVSKAIRPIGAETSFGCDEGDVVLYASLLNEAPFVRTAAVPQTLVPTRAGSHRLDAAGRPDWWNTACQAVWRAWAAAQVHIAECLPAGGAEDIDLDGNLTAVEAGGTASAAPVPSDMSDRINEPLVSWDILADLDELALPRDSSE